MSFMVKFQALVELRPILTKSPNILFLFDLLFMRTQNLKRGQPPGLRRPMD